MMPQYLALLYLPNVESFGIVALEAMAAALPPYLMEAFHPGPQVALAGLGEDSVPVGALALAAALTAS
jgi:hypothetical protein